MNTAAVLILLLGSTGQDDTDVVLHHLGVQRGIVAVVGNSISDAVDLSSKHPGAVIYAQSSDPSKVATMRRAARSTAATRRSHYRHRCSRTPLALSFGAVELAAWPRAERGGRCGRGLGPDRVAGNFREAETQRAASGAARVIGIGVLPLKGPSRAGQVARWSRPGGTLSQCYFFFAAFFAGLRATFFAVLFFAAFLAGLRADFLAPDFAAAFTVRFVLLDAAFFMALSSSL